MLGEFLTQYGNDLIDVIREVKNAAGQTSYVCEIAALEARHTTVALADVARQWFGHGRLRKVGNGIFAVLKPEPRPIRKLAPVFPHYVYHVA
jgi:hypothetical protein